MVADTHVVPIKRQSAGSVDWLVEYEPTLKLSLFDRLGQKVFRNLQMNVILLNREISQDVELMFRNQAAATKSE